MKKMYSHDIVKLADENGGILFSSVVTAHGIPREYIRRATREGYLENVARGVYVTHDALADEAYILQTQYPKAIFSHETAAYYLGYTTRDPLVYTVIIPTGYNATPLKKNGTKVYYSAKIDKSLFVKAVTPFGREIVCFSIEKTICDMCSASFKGDKDIAIEVIKSYVRSKNRNIPALIRHATTERVKKTLKGYLEVLL
ncbi:MAG: type IV toxin-antitoxin system AbiEi family antitoxin domain-containing protein [Bacillales bacterium]|jgi:predicted transcriptional regulator of viral defense system|nr:type IV toxin-antitoxin system AbiEi family antitoxin domain-containing protein [Bacillales bacterium]